MNSEASAILPVKPLPTNVAGQQWASRGEALLHVTFCAKSTKAHKHYQQTTNSKGPVCGFTNRPLSVVHDGLNDLNGRVLHGAKPDET